MEKSTTKRVRIRRATPTRQCKAVLVRFEPAVVDALTSIAAKRRVGCAALVERWALCAMSQELQSATPS